MKTSGDLIFFPPAAGAYSAEAEKQRNYIGRQLARARKTQKLSLAAFSQLLAAYGVEITPAGVNKWELGKAVPNAYQLFAIAAALGLDGDLQYFSSKAADLSPEGLRKLRDYKEDLLASGRYAPLPDAPQEVAYVEMPVSCLSASAGTGQYLDDGAFEMVRFPEQSVPHGAEFGLRVSGDSMEPVYHDGQIVWVSTCRELRPGQVGIFQLDGSGYIKLYQEQAGEDAWPEEGVLRRQPVLVSYNEAYAPIVVSADAEFRIVGRVL